MKFLATLIAVLSYLFGVVYSILKVLIILPITIPLTIWFIGVHIFYRNKRD